MLLNKLQGLLTYKLVAYKKSALEKFHGTSQKDEYESFYES